MDKPADPIVFGPEYDPLDRLRDQQTDTSTAPVVSRPRTDDTQLIDGRAGTSKTPAWKVLASIRRRYTR